MNDLPNFSKEALRSILESAFEKERQKSRWMAIFSPANIFHYIEEKAAKGATCYNVPLVDGDNILTDEHVAKDILAEVQKHFGGIEGLTIELVPVRYRNKTTINSHNGYVLAINYKRTAAELPKSIGEWTISTRS